MRDDGPDQASTDDANFAASMRLMREQRGWSQGELARRLTEAGLTGFHQTTVSRIEKMERPVRLGEARGIARTLGVDVEEMLAPTRLVESMGDLKEAVSEIRGIGRSIGQGVSDYLQSKARLKIYFETADEEYQKSNRSGIQAGSNLYWITAAKEEIARSYADFIDEHMRSESGADSMAIED